MKILIIGGTGNISTPITKALQKRDIDITLFNFDSNRPEWLSPDVKVISGNRALLPDYEKQLFSEGNYDCVIDMICFEPEDAEKDIKLFRGRTKQFIFCSTVDVYTKTPACYPVNEDGEIGALPSFQYGYKKMLCEKLFWAAQQSGDFKLTVMRPTGTYNESWSPSVSPFGGQTYHLDRVRKGKPIIVPGDGNSIWVQSYRDDTASAFIGAVGNKKAYGQAYNVTSDEWMTHNYIWKTIARVMNAPEPDFVYIPTFLLAKLAPVEAEWCRENFMYNTIYDNSKAKRDLGFRYTIRFEQGARMCVEYLEKHNLIENSDNYPFYDKIVDAWRRFESGLLKEF
jgi:nucleoside-diphosphate-sugar epimerase